MPGGLKWSEFDSFEWLQTLIESLQYLMHKSPVPAKSCFLRPRMVLILEHTPNDSPVYFQRMRMLTPIPPQVEYQSKPLSLPSIS